TVSGAHLNPAVSMAFAARGDFPWKRVPAYVVAQFLGAILATLVLWAFVGKQGTAGLTLPGSGISAVAATLREMVLTAGLVSATLGPGPGQGRLDRVVGVPGRPGGRRPDRGGHRVRAARPRRGPKRGGSRTGHDRG